MIQKKYGGLKIIWHPGKLDSFLKGEVSAPPYVRFKPTNRCNHDCFYCVYNPDFSGIHAETNRQDEIPFEKIMEILNDFKEMGIKAVTYSGGGEPLMHPNIIEVLKKTLEYDIDLSMITNGQRLKGEAAEILRKAKWVRVSIDSCDPVTFSETRNRPENWFNELAENIKNFSKIKESSCVLGINFVVNEKNKNHVYKAAEFYKNLGADHIKFSAAWKSEGFSEYHNQFKEDVVAQIKKAKEDFAGENFEIYDTYESDFSLSGVSERKYNRCYVMQTIPVIGADSRVYFCHNKAYDDTGVLGSIKDQSFKELWFSKEAAEKFKNFNPNKSCRHQCTNDAKNIFIHDALNSFGEHVNFI
jgi:MoaA/NifB/PqqE/SkfB family radical SAM enzyme